MGVELASEWRSSFASALEWWRDAGVDTLVDDDPRDWMARPEPVPVPGETLAAAPPAPEVLPATLDAFIEWRLSDAAPEANWLSPHIAPDGPADAKFVILADMPCPGDSDRLMQGAEGRLLDRMLAAIGLQRESVYVASLAIARPVTGMIPPDQEQRLIELARHHLSLLAPERLLLFGSAAAKVAAAGNSAYDGLEDVNLFGGKTRAVASHHPRFLMERPAAKSEAWKHLLWLSRGA